MGMFVKQFFFIFTASLAFDLDQPVSTYIVKTNVPSRLNASESLDSWYHFLVTSSLSNEQRVSKSQPQLAGPSRIFYKYDTIFDGFAARLTHRETQSRNQMPGVIRVVKDAVVARLHTIRSAEFLGLNQNFGFWPEADFGGNVNIGLVDGGIWPESPSFNDNGLGPVPPTWKDSCSQFITCNKKLIGERTFTTGLQYLLSNSNSTVADQSPRDVTGHGTHTASTATGAPVANASMLGIANDTARGIALKARIAIYRDSNEDNGCAELAFFASMESAIADGVHILSLSIGPKDEDAAQYENAISGGAFASARRGIFVACSAGNSGPNLSTLVNTAPWQSVMLQFQCFCTKLIWAAHGLHTDQMDPIGPVL